jgi:hypothetical protein
MHSHHEFGVLACKVYMVQGLVIGDPEKDRKVTEMTIRYIMHAANHILSILILYTSL